MNLLELDKFKQKENFLWLEVMAYNNTGEEKLVEFFSADEVSLRDIYYMALASSEYQGSNVNNVPILEYTDNSSDEGMAAISPNWPYTDGVPWNVGSFEAYRYVGDKKSKISVLMEEQDYEVVRRMIEAIDVVGD